MAILLDGKTQAQVVRDRVKNEISNIASIGTTDNLPTMAVVQVGADPASTIYIRQKERACAEVGLGFKRVSLPEDITQDAMLAEIDALNVDSSLHGYLVQQPLPRHLDTDIIVDRIDPKKDIDCLHPYNVGLVSEGRGVLMPCTPYGVINLLDSYDIDLDGKHCVILGRSRIVGKPLGMMMLNRNATVTYCHSRTKNLADICRQADVLAVAIGKANFVTADMIKDECILVDVGINRINDKETGKKICGDVDFNKCFEKASYITPVPGGVGPMTVAMLMANALKAWQNK